uniref:RNA-directed DNA polymerase n=1 Tax=Photinus pyralis TaxID=7054 RepID=A0A1Y1KSY3_PHOPY
MRRFRIYLLGKRFTVKTDCNAIRATMTKRDLIPRIGRWWLLTQEYDFYVEYRPGIKMAHVDALSRNSLPGEGIDFDNDAHLLHLNVNEDDWVLAAQLNDDFCKRLHSTLTKEPIDDEEKRVHDERWVVPKTARSQIVFYHHDNVGHFGAEKTCAILRRKYWFPDMK